MAIASLPQLISANSAGDYALAPKNTRDVGKISWGTAELSAAGKKVPENFSQANHNQSSFSHCGEERSLMKDFEIILDSKCFRKIL